MAERRMFAKTIIDSDAFLDMPLSAQALYFHLSMRADDDGFINNARKIQRMIGASDDDLKLLLAKNFLIPFDSGIVVVKHWRIHNYIRNDRKHETKYFEEMSMLEVKENGAYTISATKCPSSDGQLVGKLDTEVRLGKDSIGKDSIIPTLSPSGGNTTKPKKSKKNEEKKKLSQKQMNALIDKRDFSDPVKASLKEWVQYKNEKGQGYVNTGFEKLLTGVENKVKKYGEEAIISLIDECMSNNYTGIIYDILAKRHNNKPAEKSPGYKQFEQREYDFTDLEKQLLGN